MRLTDALRAEHAVFHTLFDTLDRSAHMLTEIGQVHTAARLLGSVLQFHGEAEDKLLMPIIEPLLSELGQDEKFHEEHHAIDEGLEKILACHDLNVANRALERVVQIARAHFDLEERVVFPLTEERVNAASLEKLGREWAMIKQTDQKS